MVGYLQGMVYSTMDRNRIILLGVSVLAVSALLILRDIFGLPINKFLFVGVVSLSCLMMNYSYIIAFFFFLMPILNGLPGNFILPTISIILIMKKGSLMSINAFMYFFLLLLFEIFHFPFYSFSINFPLTVGYLSAIFLLCYMVSANAVSIDYNRCLLFFCIGNAIFMLLILGLSIKYGGSVASLIMEGNRIGETKELVHSLDGELMISANPNGLGAYAITGAAIIFILYKNQIINILTMSSFIILFLLVGTFSLSRTFFLCLAVFLILVINTASIKVGHKNYAKMLFFVMSVGVLLYMIVNNELVYDAVYNRFMQDDVSTASGRTEIMEMYNDWLMQNPIYFFTGTGAIHYQEVVNLPSACHNAMQQILVSYGIGGLFYFAIPVFSKVKFYYEKFKFVYLIPFIVVFISVQASRVLNPWNNLYLFFVAFYAMKSGQIYKKI